AVRAGRLVPLLPGDRRLREGLEAVPRQAPAEADPRPGDPDGRGAAVAVVPIRGPGGPDRAAASGRPQGPGPAGGADGGPRDGPGRPARTVRPPEPPGRRPVPAGRRAAELPDGPPGADVASLLRGPAVPGGAGAAASGRRERRGGPARRHHAGVAV